MIDVKILRRSKGTGTSGGGGGASYVGGGATTEAAHAARADKAGYADKAAQAEQAEYADRAGYSSRSAYADRAGDLDDDAPILEKFLRKDIPDTAAGKITFQQGFDSQAPSTTSGLDNTGDLTNTGDVIVGKDSPTHDDNPVSKSKNFNQGTAGWYIDNFGNMELESLTVRSFLEVTELLINRLQAQEGDTIFTDNDQITDVQRVVEHEGTQNETVSYILTLKEKWEGYFTAQQEGNIVKGIINTLAAKQSGASDYSDVDDEIYSQVINPSGNPYMQGFYELSGGEYVLTEDTEVATGKNYYKLVTAQGTDAGGNLYYTSWMRVTDVIEEDVLDEDNQPTGKTVRKLKVTLYGDTDVPAQRNFPPCLNMTIGRWGCYLNPNEASTVADRQSREKRQRLFFISASDGRIMKLRGVNKPILEQGNYGTTLGTIPDFMWSWPKVAKDAIPNRDYLYAQGVICQSFIQVKADGEPIVEYVDCGEWTNGTTYLCNEWNNETGRYETHDVWAWGNKWRCLQHQPVVSQGVTTYYEPKWNSPYWSLIEGNTNYSIEFVSSNGLSFRRGAVNTVITPYVYYGQIDITEQVPTSAFSWKRHEQRNDDGQGHITYTEQDITWNNQHQGTLDGIKNLPLSNIDMPTNWSSINKAIFTLTVTLNDGNNIEIVQNQIIS